MEKTREAAAFAFKSNETESRDMMYRLGKMECFSYAMLAGNSMSDASNDGFGAGFSESYSCSSSDSSRNGDVAFPSGDVAFPGLGHPFSNIPDHGVVYSDQSSNISFNGSDSQGSAIDDTYHYHHHHHHPNNTTTNNHSNNRTNRYRVFGLGGSSKLRNASVSSPSPQQVSWKLAPFVHVGPSSWQWQSAVAADADQTSNNSSNYTSSRRGSQSKTTSFINDAPPPLATHDPRCPAARRGAFEPHRVVGPPSAAVGQPRYNTTRADGPLCSVSGQSRYNLTRVEEPPCSESGQSRYNQTRVGGPPFAVVGQSRYNTTRANGPLCSVSGQSRYNLTRVEEPPCSESGQSRYNPTPNEGPPFAVVGQSRYNPTRVEGPPCSVSGQSRYNPTRNEGPPCAVVGQSRYNPTRTTRPRQRLSTCDDPHSDLLRNGRDVDMDALDVMQVRMRESECQGNSSLGSTEVIGSGQPRHATRPGGGGGVPVVVVTREPLKRRLANIRSLIREELAEQAALEDSRGLYGPRRKDRGGKNSRKCKFCLSKKEDPEIVAHHNLFDAKGLVNCPILQQYECELCHATGRYAHTLKYCPENNPDTPHDVILQARLKVMIRNRRGQ